MSDNYKNKYENITYKHFLDVINSNEESIRRGYKTEPLVNKDTGEKYSKKEVFRKAYLIANKEELPKAKDKANKYIRHNKMSKTIINKLIRPHKKWAIIKESGDKKNQNQKIATKKNAPDFLDDIESYKSDFITLNKTEQQSIIKSRIGQGIFRDRLIEIWGGCSVTGLSNLFLLRASHIKPWRDCSNEERLDPYNGLLLNPILDHLFDAGYITFNNERKIQISIELSESDLKILSIQRGMTLRILPNKIKKYLHYHQEHIFING